MDDAPSTVLLKGCKMPSSGIQAIVCALDMAVKMGLRRVGRCRFCGSWGVIVDKFPRRGYGPGAFWGRNGMET
jgi:hypothetical protein